jgi:hypothetical protein
MLFEAGWFQLNNKPKEEVVLGIYIHEALHFRVSGSCMSNRCHAKFQRRALGRSCGFDTAYSCSSFYRDWPGRPSREGPGLVNKPEFNSQSWEWHILGEPARVPRANKRNIILMQNILHTMMHQNVLACARLINDSRHYSVLKIHVVIPLYSSWELSIKHLPSTPVVKDVPQKYLANWKFVSVWRIFLAYDFFLENSAALFCSRLNVSRTYLVRRAEHLCYFLDKGWFESHILSCQNRLIMFLSSNPTSSNRIIISTCCLLLKFRNKVTYLAYTLPLLRTIGIEAPSYS